VQADVVEADLVSVADEALGDAVGLPWSTAGRVVGEDVSVLDRRVRRPIADRPPLVDTDLSDRWWSDVGRFDSRR